jgi:S1-C subfamily serine protease
MLLRLLSTALLATCAVLLATFEPVRLEVAAGAGSCAGSGCAGLVRTGSVRAPDVESVTVVDVAAGVPARQIARLLQLGPAEHVAAVNDRPVDSDLEVGALIASLPPGPGEFLDVTVAGPTTERRVLVLVH